MKDMILVGCKEFSQESGLRQKRFVSDESGIQNRATFPTELAPKSTVKQGSSCKARPTV